MATPNSRAGFRSRFWLILKMLFGIVLLYFCLAFLIPKWQTLRLSDRVASLGPGWLAAAFALTLLHYLAVSGLWLALLRLFGPPYRISAGYRAFVLSLLPKYVPGKIVAPGVRAHLAVQAGISGQQTSAALIWGAVLGLASAVVVSIIGLLANPHSSITAHATWLILIFALAFTAFVAVGSSRFVRASWREWSGLSELARRPRMFASALGFYSATWVIAGAGHWSLANALAPTPAELFPSLVIAVAVSWGFGVISIIAPAGVGVREGVLFIFVRGWMSQGDALLFVTLSRLLMFATEVLLLGTWMLLAFSGIIQRSATPNVERS